MKKNIGSVIGLYPTPSTIVGTVIGDTVNWINTVHIGSVELDSIMISSRKSHYTNQGIKDNKSVFTGIENVSIFTKINFVSIPKSFLFHIV